MQLDEYQKAAAEATESRIIITAVPGSGKTRTLCARVLNLIESGVHPSNIAMVTFTRYAANEMRERLGEQARGMFVGTFHAFALRIVMQYGHLFGWESDWLTILDPEECSIEELEILKDLGLVDSKGKWTVKDGRRFWDMYRSGNLHHPYTIDGVIDKAVMKRMEAAGVTLTNRLRAENTLTYDMIIREAAQLLSREDLPAQSEIRAQYKHILVDEAQDTDSTQWRVLRMINPDNLCVVGDGDQAIYEWRGASPKELLLFATEAKHYSLPYSYRFDAEIAQPATALIRHNVERLDAAITSMVDHSGSLKVEKDASVDDIADLIREELRSGSELDDIAVLARRHKTLDDINMELTSRSVPTLKIGGQKSIRNTAEFRAVRGYLRLGVNPRDRRAFVAIATIEGISNQMLLDMRAEAVRSGTPIRELYKEPLPTTMRELWDYLPQKAPDAGWLPVFSYLSKIQETEGLSDPGDLVRYLAISDQQDDLRDAKDKLTLCTIHAAKGLEWPVVFLVGMNACQFPSPRSVREERLEEERRLCYVGMTRAENALYLVNGRPEHEKDVPSQFLDEMEVM